MKAFIPGVWDLLHSGHVETLKGIYFLNDKLDVGIASDEVVKIDKGKYPIIPLEQRIYMLYALDCVNHVIPYTTFDFIDPVKISKPDIVYLGNYCNEMRYQRLEQYCKNHHIKIEKIKRSEKTSTTEIIEKCSLYRTTL